MKMTSDSGAIDAGRLAEAANAVWAGLGYYVERIAAEYNRLAASQPTPASVTAPDTEACPECGKHKPHVDTEGRQGDSYDSIAPHEWPVAWYFDTDRRSGRDLRERKP
jgi:hypothetical protein